ncbi:hypothetical protein SteCoe_26806 [Stentor coeruleus]|uniref:PH domain-containing protein n=1 Tax=Stentor coeruleus TaxID=5963 RepID=A0A1R2BC14_9CILI|nr:hypothetical protein SteCoe_26806 [Stentor coeruleus]
MGNYGCGCSDYLKEDDDYDKTIRSDTEEIIEFQSNLYNHNSINPVIAASFPISQDRTPSAFESKQSTFITDNNISEIEGEMYRYQLTSKEILIPRWCVFNSKGFKYFKNQYSFFCKDKPLFEINIERIIQGKAYSRSGRLFIEITYSKSFQLFSSSSSVVSLTSARLSYSQLTQADMSKHRKATSNFNNFDETLIFVITSKKEWENWKKNIQMYKR